MALSSIALSSTSSTSSTSLIVTPVPSTKMFRSSYSLSSLFFQLLPHFIFIQYFSKDKPTLCHFLLTLLCASYCTSRNCSHHTTEIISLFIHGILITNY
jgi:hypothetical protein